MAFTDQQREEIKDAAELKVRQYFDTYLEHTFPQQVKGLIEAHNNDPTAHDGVAAKVNRAKWTLTGAVAVIGLGAGAGLRSLVALFQ